MIKVIVRIDEKELPYEFKYMWQVEWFVRVVNWYVGLMQRTTRDG
jgi:hypothetical protein